MTIIKEKNIQQRLLVLITPCDEGHKLERVLQQLHIPLYSQCYGIGSASSEILDILGLSGTKRLITMIMIPKSRADMTLTNLSQAMSFHKKGKGIALTLTIDAMQKDIRQLLESCEKATLQQGENKMKEQQDYSMILTTVNYGYSHDVIQAAKEGGAKGGTIIKGLHHASKDAMHFLNIAMQKEQELILIIIPQETKTAVMDAIIQKCGLNTPARAIILSLPVDDVRGLEELTN